MPSNYNFTENGVVYNFDDVFVPASLFDGGAAGSLWTWGGNTNAQLGININTSRSTPVTTFAGGIDWKSVSAGTHATAIKSDGSLWVWGYNFFPVLGINSAGARSTPVTTFAGGNNWKTVSCGNAQTVAIKTDGSLWVWGSNSYGQLGTNNNLTTSTPVTTFAGGNNWSNLAICHAGHTIAATKTDGTLWVWGRNHVGQLGTNDTILRSTPVTTFAGGTNWNLVSTSSRFTAAIKTDGTLWTWGSNYTAGNVLTGTLGNNSSTNIARSTPITTFAGGTTWKSVSCGGDHIAAIKTDGTLWTWGFGTSGQMGDNANSSRVTPVTTFAGGTSWKSVSSGGSFVIAIKTDGTLWGWGANSIYPSLGVNDATNRNTPVTTFTGGNDWKSISAAGYFTLAIRY